MLFWRIKPREKESEPFRTVFARSGFAEYRGALNPTPAVRHHLVASAISPNTAAALLDQGFQPINGCVPTECYHCSFALARDRYQPRCLFQIFVDTKTLEISESWRSWLAVELAIGLKRSLQKAPDKWMLIRCNNSHEFPFCVEPEVLDEYWLTEIGVYWRSCLREIKK